MKIPFSLFEGDLVNRFFAYFRVGSRRPRALIARSIILIGATWGILALLARWSEVHQGPGGQNFFKDIAAYMQLLLGLPLFVIAERLVSVHTRDAAGQFFSTVVLRAPDRIRLEQIHRRIERLRKSVAPDIACAAIAYFLSYMTILPMLFDGKPTWHAAGPANQFPETLTAAGWWELVGALPLLNYWWLRWIWKVALWSWYLFRLSRFRLRLVAAHPDRTGGIGFLSDAQTRFGLVILAYGVTNVASTIAYKIAYEGATIELHSVWGPLVGFVIGAPLLFTVPLFMFTKQLYRLKKRALEQYHHKAVKHAVAFERQWLHSSATGRPGLMGEADLFALNNLNAVYEHIRKIRVVPFDMRSFLELMMQTLGSLLPLLPYLGIPDKLLKVLEHLVKVVAR